MDGVITRQSPREQVMQTISDWIATGRLSKQDPLPAEMVLADQMQVSRGTARAALEELEDRGVLIKRNRKRYVTDQALADRQSLLKTIALIGVDCADPSKYRSSGFVAATTAGALDELTVQGHNSLCLHSNNLNRTTLFNICQMRPDGAIFFESSFIDGAQGASLAQNLWEQNIPVTLATDGPEYKVYDRVTADFKGSIEMLMTYLHEYGCRRILPIWNDRETYWEDLKKESYAACTKQLALPFYEGAILEDDQLIRHGYNADNFVRMTRLYAGYLAEHLLGPEPVDAIMSRSDWFVPVVAGACRLLGKEPGVDVQITGYDNRCDSGPWAPFEPFRPLVTIDKDNDSIGRTLVEVCKKGRCCSDKQPPQVIRVPTKLVTQP